MHMRVQKSSLKVIMITWGLNITHCQSIRMNIAQLTGDEQLLKLEIRKYILNYHMQTDNDCYDEKDMQHAV